MYRVTPFGEELSALVDVVTDAKVDDTSKIEDQQLGKFGVVTCRPKMRSVWIGITYIVYDW